MLYTVCAKVCGQQIKSYNYIFVIKIQGKKLKLLNNNRICTNVDL